MARRKTIKHPNLAIKKILEVLKLGERELSCACGFNQSTITNYSIGRRAPYKRYAKILVKYCKKKGIQINEEQLYYPFEGIGKLKIGT